MNRVNNRLTKFEVYVGIIFVLVGALSFFIAVRNYLGLFQSNVSLSIILGTTISGLVYISFIYTVTGTVFGMLLHKFLRKSKDLTSIKAQRLHAAIEEYRFSKKAEVEKQRAIKIKIPELVGK